MRPAVLVLVALAVLGTMGGCVRAQTIPPEIPVTRVPETRALPQTPDEAPRPSEIPAGDWVEALEAGSCADNMGRVIADSTRPCPARSGIATSEERAWRDGLFRVRYRELRVWYEADRSVWAAQRELYEARIRATDAALRAAQPGWWDRNALPIGLLGGFALGVALVVSVSALAQ